MNRLTKIRSTSLLHQSAKNKTRISTNGLIIARWMAPHASLIHPAAAAATCVGDMSSSRRFQSSFTEPEQTLFHPNRLNKLDEDIKSLAGTTSDEIDLDKQLRADVKTMGSILGSTIKSYEGEDILEKIESLRLAAKVCILVLELFIRMFHALERITQIIQYG